MTPSKRTLIVGLALLALSPGVWAHTGHEASGFAAGLSHPLGADHLLAMVAVGLWSAFALPAGKAWMGPLCFMASLVLSALLGASGVELPVLEHAIALSVALFGLMIVLATRRLSMPLGLTLIAVAASLHGVAHGAEAPHSESFASYAAGFLLTTAALHVGGVFAGLALQKKAERHAPKVLAALGSAFGVAGVVLFTHV